LDIAPLFMAGAIDEQFPDRDMGAIVLNGAPSAKICLIGAGALIPKAKKKTIFPEQFTGRRPLPGRVIRTLTDDDAAKLTVSGTNFKGNAKRLFGGF